jgi:hypothetical protein
VKSYNGLLIDRIQKESHVHVEEARIEVRASQKYVEPGSSLVQLRVCVNSSIADQWLSTF